MLDEVVEALACPHCGAALRRLERLLCCAQHHVFDIARQGYVSLLSGRGASGDTAAMVAARADFLRAGHFDPIREQVADAAAESGYLLDVGAGTGDYLARVLDRRPASAGIAVDASKYACRRAAKAHPRIGAVVADAWRRLPVRTGVVSTVLDVFAPRNAEETHRVLRADGRLVVVTPDGAHLRELVTALGLISVDQRKSERLGSQLSGLFEPVSEQRVRFSMRLGAEEIAAAVAMGPSAWHIDEAELRRQVAALPTPLDVTASAVVSVYRPVPRG